MKTEAITLKQIKVGNTLQVNGSAPFQVQTIIGSRSFNLEVITSHGLPVEIRDTDELVRVHPQ